MGFAAAVGLIAAAAYIAGTGMLIRSFNQGVPVSIRRVSLLTLAALFFHGLSTYQVINTPQGLHLGIYAAASLVTLVLAGLILVASIRLPVHNLLVGVLPLAAVSVLAARFLDSSFTPITNATPALVWHIFLSVAAYAILFMATCQAILLGVLERELRSKRTIVLLRLLPPLETMESLLFPLLWVGLAALTLAIATGFVFLEDMFAQHVVHHTALSLASWLVYAILLGGHHVLGWRGTTAVRWSLIAFALLVLAYFGSKFVLEILLDQP